MPTPKPDPIAKARGRGRAPKKTTAIAHVETASVPVPSSLPAEAHELYVCAVQVVAARGGGPEDLEGIRQMCEAALYARRAAADIEANGMVIDTPLGPKVNPMLKVHKEQSARYMSIANEYGLTLAAKLRLGLMQLAGESMLASIDKELGIQVRV
jgi:P27 family predicted phage terminase small subunit